MVIVFGAPVAQRIEQLPSKQWVGRSSRPRRATYTGVWQCVPVPKGSGLRERKQDGPLAQLVEQLTLNQRATGSSPVRPTRPWASGGMADTLDLGSSAERRRSSTLLSPTNLVIIK